MLTHSARLPGWAAAVAHAFGLPRAFRVDARSALLLDFATGEVLYAQDPAVSLPPASIAKLMTLRLAWAALHSGSVTLTDKVTVSAKASWQHPALQDASLMFLEEGDIVTVEQLMKGMAIPSGSDAAVAMAEFLAGSVAAFVDAMNAEAWRLGMSHTRFVDPHGLSEANQTTAGDLALLARAYLQDAPEALPFLHAHRMFAHRGRNLAGTNLLPGSYDGADGLKTGFLECVGYGQISTARRGDHRLIGIVLGTRSKRERRNQSAALLDFGFRQCMKRS
ncbi:MAG TPA: D-alanyl-D-alanine carboxypeptidase family protein [Symbiobacteriaceae bacterium]|nr:D-alanyl-D-alanine carboxypeptidase family protein [Symbiobacteriaceae bacterium]